MLIMEKMRVDGNRIGSIVMNANPFTLGHRYLIEQALQQCDHLHLFIVGEDASQFSYTERFEMIKQGIFDLSISLFILALTILFLVQHFQIIS